MGPLINITISKKYMWGATSCVGLKYQNLLGMCVHLNQLVYIFSRYNCFNMHFILLSSCNAFVISFFLLPRICSSCLLFERCFVIVITYICYIIFVSLYLVVDLKYFYSIVYTTRHSPGCYNSYQWHYKTRQRNVPSSISVC